jgi:hypothetical protein
MIMVAVFPGGFNGVRSVSVLKRAHYLYQTFIASAMNPYQINLAQAV